MGNRKINLLKDLLKEVPSLLALSYRDNEYNKWNTRVTSTLGTLFGKDSSQYRRFAKGFRSWKRHATDEEKQQEYLRDVRIDKNTLEAIIAGLEQEEKVKASFKFRTLRTILNWSNSKLKAAWQWIKSHKVASIVFSSVIFIAAVVAIIKFFLDIF